MNRPTVALCMIVKDEEEMLVPCLESVQNYVDEIIIIDTGSADKTIKIAKRYGAKIKQVEWQDDFSRARNAGLDLAESDWILVLDADERLEKIEYSHWEELLKTPGVEGYHVQILDYLGKVGQNETVFSINLRLFRNKPEYRYNRKIHEQIENSILRANKGKNENPCRIADIKVYHYGYLKNVIDKKNKSERNLKMLETELKHSPDSFTYYNLGTEYVRLRRYEEALIYFNKCLQAENKKLAYVSECVLRKGICLYLMGRLKEAKGFLENMTKYYCQYTDLYYLLGEICHNLALISEAKKYYEKCLSIGEVTDKRYNSFWGVGSFRAFYALGLLAEEEGDKEKALLFFQRSIAANSSFEQSLLMMAKIVYQQAGKESFITEMDKQLAIKDKKTKAHLLAVACNSLGLYNEGFGCLQDVLSAEKKPGSTLYLELSRNAILADRFEEASYYLAQIRTEDHKILAQTGEIYWLLGWLAKRNEYSFLGLKIIARYNTSAVTAYFQKLNKLLYNPPEEGDKANSVKIDDLLFDKTLEIIRFFIRKGRIDLLEKALVIFYGMDDLSKWLQLAELYYMEGQEELALLEIEDCHSKGYRTLNSLVILGDIYIKKGELSKAIHILQEALELKEDSSIRKMLARVYERKAKEILYAGLTVFPDAKYLQDELKELREMKA